MRRAVPFLLAASMAAGLLAGCGGSPRDAEAPSIGLPALPFVEDDFAGALRRAKETDRPLFVEVWAPW